MRLLRSACRSVMQRTKCNYRNCVRSRSKVRGRFSFPASPPFAEAIANEQRNSVLAGSL